MKKTELMNNMYAKIDALANAYHITLDDSTRRDMAFHLSCFFIDGRSDESINKIAKKFVKMCA